MIPAARTPVDHGILVDILQSSRAAGDDMTAHQLLTLLFVSSEGPQPVRALAESLGLRESAIAAAFRELVRRGLVIGIPSSSNPHELALALSTAGHRLVDNLIYRQGRRSGAFPQVPVTADDLRRRNNEALRRI